MARAPRARHGDDLPGADDFAQPGDARWHADRGSIAAPAPALRRRRAAHGDRTLGAGRDPVGCAPADGLSARAVWRYAPARDDRDCAGRRSEAPDRRRADHGTRRDDPSADTRSVALAAARYRDGAYADHP